MSYTIYKTPAIILRIASHGEANRDVVLFTRDLGKITARAQSARKVESKMRMHMKRYGQVVVDLVRGKSVWRLTGIHETHAHHVFENEGYLMVIHRVFGLAEHLIRGEEAYPELFDFFTSLLSFNETNTQTEGLELFGVIHVLEKLGYWHGDKISDIATNETLETLSSQKKKLVAMINESIEATQIR